METTGLLTAILAYEQDREGPMLIDRGSLTAANHPANGPHSAGFTGISPRRCMNSAMRPMAWSMRSMEAA